MSVSLQKLLRFVPEVDDTDADARVAAKNFPSPPKLIDCNAAPAPAPVEATKKFLSLPIEPSDAEWHHALDGKLRHSN